MTAPWVARLGAAVCHLWLVCLVSLERPSPPLWSGMLSVLLLFCVGIVVAHCPMVFVSVLVSSYLFGLVVCRSL